MKKLYTAALFMMGLHFASSQVYTTGSFALMSDVSNNGVATGNVMTAYHIMWTEENGSENIGELTSGDYISGLTNVTSDGKYISGTMTNPETGKDEMARYDTTTKTWTYLGGLKASSDATLSSAWGMSSDGKVIVGLGWQTSGTGHGIVWREGDGITDLGSTVAERSSRANSVNDSGDIIVGWQDNDYGDRQGVYWKNGVQVPLTDNDGMPTGEAVAVTPDGKTIIGFTYDNPFIWNETAGYTKITHPDPDYAGGAASITDDGKTVVGYFRPWNGQAVTGEGFIYTQEKGRVELNEYIASLGIDNQGITFALPMAISPNGKYITGVGRTDDDIVGFVIKLPDSALSTQTAAVAKTKVYPNPVKDILHISKSENVTLAEIYNMAGQKVYSTTSVNKSGLNLSALPAGNYILQMTVNGKTESTSLIKH